MAGSAHARAGTVDADSTTLVEHSHANAQANKSVGRALECAQPVLRDRLNNVHQ